MRERFDCARERIENMSLDQDVIPAYRDYFNKLADFILGAASEFDRELKSDELMELNGRLYSDISEENYGHSYAEPCYAAEKLGKDMAPILSMFYVELLGLPAFGREKNMEAFTILMETFIQVYNLFEEEEAPSEKEVRDVIYSYIYDYCADFVREDIYEGLAVGKSPALNIVKNADLSDSRYLYLFGEPVSSSELETAEFMASLPEEKVKLMADAFTEGYIRGFAVTGRDIRKKQSVRLTMPLGYERMFREAVKNFEKAGLQVIIPRRPLRLINKRLSGGSPVGFYGHINRELEFDHRNDMALFWGDRLMEHKLEALRNAYEELEKEASKLSGRAFTETFGEKSFEPEIKELTPAYSEYQDGLRDRYNHEAMELIQKYIPEEETSFTIIAWPRPDIGERFPEVFDEVIKINTLPEDRYRLIQERLIEALDEAEHIEIKGLGENDTDMKVFLHELKDRDRETCFENCLADVNIPLGEVFTSPVLKGTEGRLKVSLVYIGDILFKDLTIDFKDGRVADYSCANFPGDRQAGRKLIEDIIFKNKKELPLGEFAIGTNTTVYAAGRRLGITDKLPILIAEKMGPHFAVGDTCYSHAEDFKVYNPDGKEIIARSNECADLREESPDKAYFNVHCDITLPYDETGLIVAVRKDGSKTEIIRDGYFVLPGTEELNIPLKEI